MEQKQLKKVQESQLEIMDEIHRICLENDITYYIIAGTALGSVRHKGFIPWDLDIDIALPRNDYDKMKKICKEKMNSKFIYRDHLNTTNFIPPHALICIKNTTLVNRFDKFNPDIKNLGIYLDVFPLDNAPDNPLLREEQEKKLKRLKKIKNYKLALSHDSSKVKKIIKKLIRFTLFWISVEKINTKMDNIMRKYNDQNTTHVCSMASGYSYTKQCILKQVYGKPTEVIFENRKYFAPEKIHEYLLKIYGDYMKLPSIEEQKANLDIFEEVFFDK